MEGGMDVDDQQIVKLFWDRSERALEELACRYERLVFSVTRNILGDEEDAAECVNDTYLGVWNAIPPHCPQNLAAFVCRIAKNLALKQYRSRRAAKRSGFYEVSLEELGQALRLPGELAVSEQADAGELGREIDRFLDGLSQKDRILFVRRYWFGDPVKELAENLGISQNNISVRLSRLRRRLKRHLEKEELL